MPNLEPIKVVIVDDSRLIRKMLFTFVETHDKMQVIAEGENGEQAISLASEHKPDIMLLDVEMPIKNGLQALPGILKASPDTKVIMISTLTSANAAISVSALASGASDYLEKPTSKTNLEDFERDLRRKVIALSRREIPVSSSNDSENKVKRTQEIVEPKVLEPVKEEQPKIQKPAISLQRPAQRKPRALAIGCSTGGPQALIEVFKGMEDKINDVPTFITQHMPANFTKFLAENISKLGFRTCVEGVDGEPFEQNKIYLAPGDYHMKIRGSAGLARSAQLNQEPPINFCRPSVDPMVESLADIYGAELLVVIMTGMGSDGLEGVRYAYNKGATIIIQDEASSVVWGMPGAVAEAKFYDHMLPLDKIASKIISILKGI